MLQERKSLRLKDYDYSSVSTYFITVCTKDRRYLLSHIIVGRDDLGAPLPIVALLPAGKIAESTLKALPEHYPGVSLDDYVIMPNHVHLLLTIENEAGRGAPGSSRPTVSQMISAWKRITNKSYGKNIWQTSFYDHIIRNVEDFTCKAQYILDNPAKWAVDEYCCV